MGSFSRTPRLELNLPGSSPRTHTRGHRSDESETIPDEKSDHCTSAELTELSLNDPTREFSLPPSLPFLSLPQMTFDFEDTIKFPSIASFSPKNRHSVATEEPSPRGSTKPPTVAELEEEEKEIEEIQEENEEEEVLQADQVEIDVEGFDSPDFPAALSAFTLQNTSECSLVAAESPRQRNSNCDLVAVASTITAVHTEIASNIKSPRHPTILEAWTGFFDRAYSTDRRLFGVLGLCALIQTAAELFLIALFLSKKAYVAFGIALLFAFPLSVFGILASRYRGKRYLGLYCGAMVLWQTWATLHVTLMIHRPLNLVTAQETSNILANAFVSQDVELRGLSIFIFTLYLVHLLLCVIAVMVILGWFLFPTQARPHWELNRRTVRSAPVPVATQQEARQSIEEPKPLPSKDFATDEKPHRNSSQSDSVAAKIKSWIVRLKAHPNFVSHRRNNTNCCTINSQTSRASNASIFFHTANSNISSFVQTRPSSWLSRNSSIEPQHAAEPFPKKFGGSLPANLNYMNIQPNFSLPERLHAPPRPNSDHWSQASGGSIRKSLPPSLVSDKEGASALPSPMFRTSGGYTRMPLTPCDAPPALLSFERQDTFLSPLPPALPKPAIIGRSVSLVEGSTVLSQALSVGPASRRHSVFSHLPAYLPDRICPSLPTSNANPEKRILAKPKKPYPYRHRPSPLFT